MISLTWPLEYTVAYLPCAIAEDETVKMENAIAVDIETIEKSLLLIIIHSSCLLEIKYRRGKTGGTGENFNQIRPTYDVSRIRSFDGR